MNSSSTDRRGKRWLRLSLGVSFSAVGLILVLRGVDWRALAVAFRGVQPGWLALAVVVELIAMGVSAVRWRWLFWPHYRPSTAGLFGLMGSAQLVNTVLPGHLGIAFRAVMVGGEGRVSRSMALTTLVVEKILEGMTLLPLAVALFLLPTVGFASPFPNWLRISAALSALLLIASMVLLWLAASRRWQELLLRRVPPPLAGLIRSLLDGLDALRSAGARKRLWGLSVVYWALLALVNELVIRAIGLDLPWTAPLVLLVILQVGVRLPSSPANLGVFDYLGVASLALFGVERTVALGVTLWLHLVLFLPPSLVGVAYLLSSGLDWGALRRAREVRW